MANTNPAALTSEQLRVVDSARTKLDQLTKSIEAAMRAVALGNPMPDVSSIMAHAGILTQTTSSITSYLSTHSDLLSTLVAYPSPQFPGRQHEGLAGVLLRKKMEPGVESWVEEGRIIGASQNTSAFGQSGPERNFVQEITKGLAHATTTTQEPGKLEDDWKQAAMYTVQAAGRLVDSSREEADRMEEESSEDEDADGDAVMGGQGAGDEFGVAGLGRGRSVLELARFSHTGLAS